MAWALGFKALDLGFVWFGPGLRISKWRFCIARYLKLWSLSWGHCNVILKARFVHERALPWGQGFSWFTSSLAYRGFCSVL